MVEVSLKPIASENWQDALRLSVEEGQQPFVSDVVPVAAIALAKAFVRPGGKVVEPYGIYHGDLMVGFLNLHYTPGSQDDFWVFHFFIDRRFQRQGFGSAAMIRLVQHIRDHHPACACVRITVHPENQSAQRFYRSLGFSEDYVLTHGEPTYSLTIPKDGSMTR